MLTKILNLFKERKIINLSDLSIHFKTDRSAMQGMLQQLIRKGYIELLNAECSTCSANCKSCSFVEEKEYYRLNED
ncbi:MAG TPA: sugar metabolism transcriptional regulator [Candidatus Cloacimonetes bacterium]|nr:sugar metabolism transcriptional regulator [Candidatus Cloacimonadota bacterium]